MRNESVCRLAEVLVGYSTDVQPGDKVLIQAGILARPLVEELYRLILRQGAFPILQLGFDSLNRIFYKEATDSILRTLPEHQMMLTERADVFMSIRAPENTRELQGIDAAKMQLWSQTMRPIQEHIMAGNVRWVVCNFPTLALAQEADMSLEEYSDFVFRATNIDWRSAVSEMEWVKSTFDAADEVRILSHGTDLSLRLGSRKGIVADGRRNMPDGEVFYAPLKETVNGVIEFEYPSIRQGRQVSGIRLVFKDGQVVEATADTGQDFLDKALNTDAGARFVGEFGIGCNYNITRYTKDTLFDEKIGGTIHLALGRAYPECGGTNESAIHWDLVKDLRQGGRLYADGRLVQEEGRFQR